MRILEQDYRHLTQASGLRLNLYRYEPPAGDGVPGMMPQQAGFLVTEERIGSGAVVATLGFFADEAPARDALTRRSEALVRQGWHPATGPLAAPSFPPGGLDISEPEGARAALATRTEPARVDVPGDETPRPARPV